MDTPVRILRPQTALEDQQARLVELEPGPGHQDEGEAEAHARDHDEIEGGKAQDRGSVDRGNRDRLQDEAEHQAPGP
jgi:hypothetical protein